MEYIRNSQSATINDSKIIQGILEVFNRIIYIPILLVMVKILIQMSSKIITKAISKLKRMKNILGKCAYVVHQIS